MFGKLTFKKDSLHGIIGTSSEGLCGILAQFCVGCGVAEMFKAGAIKLRRFHDHYLAAFVAMRYCCVLSLSLSLRLLKQRYSFLVVLCLILLMSNFSTSR